MLATIRPRDLPGKTRLRLAAELITEIEAIDKKIRNLKKELTELVTAAGPRCWSCTHRPLGRRPAAG